MKKLLPRLLILAIVPVISLLPQESRATDTASVKHTIRSFKNKDSGINRFFRNSYAYAVFPTVGKGGIGIGGAYGTGYVYRRGTFAGTAKLTQVSIGFQLGGQAYSEIIFFQTKSAYRRFSNNKLKIGAQVSAVAVTKGAAANAAFNQGIAIFTATKGGLMYEASIAGQTFKFTKLK